MMVCRDLEILKIDNIGINTATRIVENSRGHLREILLKHDYYDDYEEDYFNEQALIFIRKIYEHCPLVEYLSLLFSPSKEILIEFEKFLKVCQKLKSLFLIGDWFIPNYEKMLENGEELLKVLIRLI